MSAPTMVRDVPAEARAGTPGTSTILALALAMVLVMALAGVIWTVADGRDTTSPDVLVTIFSSALSGLLGLYVRSPR